MIRYEKVHSSRDWKSVVTTKSNNFGTARRSHRIDLRWSFRGRAKPHTNGHAATWRRPARQAVRGAAVSSLGGVKAADLERLDHSRRRDAGDPRFRALGSRLRRSAVRDADSGSRRRMGGCLVPVGSSPRRASPV